METQKEKAQTKTEEYWYACCPYCRNTLTQGKNGTDIIIKCTQCGQYLHVVIRDDSVMTERKSK